ncbi:MAG TPA: Maf family protein [Chloroflexia bacterium]|nr:Maf family protein [Chloroflexia bacterium]
MNELVLASGSPRRIELLARLVPSFVPVTSGAEEAGSDLAPPVVLPPLVLAPPFPVAPEEDPRLWAWRKAMTVLNHPQDLAPGDRVVLAADTIVVGPGHVLNKPTDIEDARRMLNLLRGTYHYVVTGFVLARRRDEAVEATHHEAVISTVFMRDFPESELEAYVATDEPYDKAGGYALQGLGGRLVDRVEGCINNVIGLPVCTVRSALKAHGVEVLPYPFGGYCAHCPLVTG